MVRWSEPVRPRTRPDGVARYDGIGYGLITGFRPLLLDLWVPPSRTPPPVAVWIHGGGWWEGDRRYLPPTLPPDSLFERAVAAGLAIASVDYRLSAEATFPAQLHDVKAAIRYLRRFAADLGVDGARIGVGGESAGGHLAALAGLVGCDDPGLEGDVGVRGPSSAVRCVLDWYGVNDLAAVDLNHPGDPLVPLLGGTSAELVDRASPVRYVTAEAPPFLLIHGEADSVVPIAQSEALHSLLRQAGGTSELVRVPGADHCFAGSPDVDAILDRSVAFWVRTLGS